MSFLSDLKNFFRSRLPSQLTLPQIRKLSNQSNLSFEEIDQWYERFILGYPYGYVSLEEFSVYLQQLNLSNGHREHHLSKAIIRQLFRAFDTNKDQRLDFEEFFRFHFLVNYGSEGEKLHFILSFHEPQAMIYYTEQELVSVLTSMFNLFDIAKLTNDLPEKIDTILNFIQSKDRKSKISWNTFCTYIFEQPCLLELLIFHTFVN